MSTDVMRAAEALAEAIEAENAALRVMDIPRALAVLPSKAERVRLLQLALPALAASPAGDQGRARVLIGRLQGLAAENKTLLERALAAQSHLIRTLVAAGPKTQSGYGRRGLTSPATGPLALSARA